MDEESAAPAPAPAPPPAAAPAPTKPRLDDDGPPIKKKHKKRKASNGRLKKLWRRATTQTMGITSRKEWNEMLELHSDWKSSHKDNPDLSDVMGGSLPGSGVILSKDSPSQDFTNIDNWQVTEGSDHRDIIMNLLFRQSSVEMAGDGLQKKKKRKLADAQREPICQSSSINVPTLPSWSNVRNLGGMNGLAVIEVSIEDCNPGLPCPLMPSERIKEVTDGTNSSWTSYFGNSNSSAVHHDNSNVQRSITACKVNLFQGNKHPRCLSDVLMFIPPQFTQSEPDKKKQSIDIIDAIYSLRLTPKQIRSEGYPLVIGQESMAGNKEVVESKVRGYSKDDVDGMTTDAVVDLIKTLAVKVSFGDDRIIEDAVEHSDYEHYVKTFSRSKDVSSRRPKIFSIDCEMVQTKAGMELARVSVLEVVGDGSDEKSFLLLDELVKPRNDVLDYLTHYSGITPKMLQQVETRIESIQLILLALIHEEDIIIGHSAENDLRSLRLVHCNIVDTSVVFRGDNGRKYSLKHLSNVLLQRQIQHGCDGHCSQEDAEACLLLALRRAKLGSSFRLKESSRHQHIIDVFQKAKRDKDTHDDSGGESSFAERNERSSVCIGPSEWLAARSVGNGSQHMLSCESILSSMAMAVPSWLASKKPSRAGLLWAKLLCKGSRDGFKDELRKQDEIMNSLISVPTDTPILVVFQRNYSKASDLTRQRKAATNPKAACVWSDCQEDEWKQYMSSCRACEALWIGSSCQQTSIPKQC